MRPWRVVESAVTENPILTPLRSVDEARVILDSGMGHMLAQYTGWIRLLEEKEKGARLPRISPWLFFVTTGVGKSTLLRALIKNAILLAAGGGALTLVPDHKQADEYEKDGWWHYYGRNPDPKSPGYCPNYAEMMRVVEAGHIPQNTFCHRCQNGQKWAIEYYDEHTDNYKSALKKLQAHYSPREIHEIVPCVWQSHLRHTFWKQFVVACSTSYSETLAKWSHYWDRREVSTHRLVLVDEHADLVRSIEIGMPDLDVWARRNASHTALLGKSLDQLKMEGAGEADQRQVQDAILLSERASVLFPALATQLAQWIGRSGRITINAPLKSVITEIIEIAGTAETAPWEYLDFSRDGHLQMAPLRAAYAIAQTLKFEDGHVDQGRITVAATNPLLDRLGKRPIAFFDATPNPVTRAVVKAADGHEIKAICKQNIIIIRHPAHFWGLTAFGNKDKGGKVMPAERKKREVQKYQALLKLYPSYKALIHKKVYVALGLDGDDKSKS